MWGSLISGLMFRRTQTALAKAAKEDAEFRHKEASVLHEQKVADEFMRRNGCHIVIIKPDGSMVQG